MSRNLSEPWRLFIMTLGTSLIVFTLLWYSICYIENQEIIKPLTQPFKVCSTTKVLHPGEVLCYFPYYMKFKAIPGEISKQLVSTDDPNDIVRIPLPDGFGNLPVGESRTRAYVKIPEFTPFRTFKLKLSSSYPHRKASIAFTEEFKVVPKE